MITPAEAHDMIQRRHGFTEDPRTGCWLVGPDLQGPTGMGPYLAAYIAVFGDPPSGFDVFHRCPGAMHGCIRPSHLDVAPAGSRIPLPLDPVLAWELRGSFPARLRDERAARRASRVDFARELRISPRTLKAWEDGERAPSGDTYKRIARELGWDGQPRKWAVLFVHEEVVTATTSGEAMRMVWNALEREDRPRKTVVHSVRPATK